MIKTMICPVCKEKGLKSRVSEGMTLTTAMYCAPYYDEDGNYHVHDLNTSTTNFNCSNNHHFSIASRNACPSYPSKCNHGGEEVVNVTKE